MNDLARLRTLLAAARLGTKISSLPVREQRPSYEARDDLFALSPDLARCVLAWESQAKQLHALLHVAGTPYEECHEQVCKAAAEPLSALAEALEASRG